MQGYQNQPIGSTNDAIPVLNGDNRQSNGQFGPGNNANPTGRPVGAISIITHIKRKLAEIPIGQMTTYAEQAAELMIRQAIVDKDGHMLREIMHYVDGMPKQKIDIGGDKESIAELTDFFKMVAAKKEQIEVPITPPITPNE